MILSVFAVESSFDILPYPSHGSQYKWIAKTPWRNQRTWQSFTTW